VVSSYEVVGSWAIKPAVDNCGEDKRTQICGGLTSHMGDVIEGCVVKLTINVVEEVVLKSGIISPRRRLAENVATIPDDMAFCDVMQERIEHGIKDKESCI